MFAAHRQAVVTVLVSALALALSTTAPAVGVAVAATAAPGVAAAVKGDPTRGALALRPEAPNPMGWILYETDSVGHLKMQPQETRTFDMTHTDSTIPYDATAVVLGVTVSNMTRSGLLTVWGAGRARPTPASLNFSPGTPVSNLAIVANTSAGGGKVSVYNGSLGTVDFVVSFQGWQQDRGSTVRPGSFRATTPARVIDTRTTGGPIPAKGYRDFAVTGRAGIPAEAGAAALNIVAVKPSRAGYLIAHSPSLSRPATTSLTYQVGADRATFTVVPLSSTGKVRLWNMSAAPVNVVIDAHGWARSGDTTNVPGATNVARPTRVLDTRSTGTKTLKAATGLPFVATSHRPATLALFNVTATGATRSGHLRLSSSTAGATPFLYFAAGRTTTATVLAPLVDGVARIGAVTSGDVQVIVDRVALVEAPFVVSGRVTDAITGEPVSGALVNGEVRTTANGSYTVPLDYDSYTLAVCVAKDDGPITYLPSCADTAISPPDVGTPITQADIALQRSVP